MWLRVVLIFPRWGFVQQNSIRKRSSGLALTTLKENILSKKKKKLLVSYMFDDL